MIAGYRGAGKTKKIVTRLQQVADVVHLEIPIERNGKPIARVVVGLSKQHLEAEARAAAAALHSTA